MDFLDSCKKKSFVQSYKCLHKHFHCGVSDRATYIGSAAATTSTPTTSSSTNANATTTTVAISTIAATSHHNNSNDYHLNSSNKWLPGWNRNESRLCSKSRWLNTTSVSKTCFFTGPTKHVERKLYNCFIMCMCFAPILMC